MINRISQVIFFHILLWTYISSVVSECVVWSAIVYDSKSRVKRKHLAGYFRILNVLWTQNTRFLKEKDISSSLVRKFIFSWQENLSVHEDVKVKLLLWAKIIYTRFQILSTKRKPYYSIILQRAWKTTHFLRIL